MPSNYEIKIPVTNYNELKKKALGLKSHFKKFSRSLEKQKDIYYNVPSGRLKLRIINDNIGNLIYYKRADNSGKRISNYIISRAEGFKELDLILQNIHAVKVTIEKSREIFIFDNVRVHLDKVKSLGSFLELEVIFTNLAKAKKQLKFFIDAFGLNESKFINGSYADLLLKKI